MKVPFEWSVLVRRVVALVAVSPLAMSFSSTAQAAPPATAQPGAKVAQTAAESCPLEQGKGAAKSKGVTTVVAAKAVTPKVSGGSYVYTLDNDPNQNGIVVLGRRADGSLMPVAGSPFKAGGKGLAGGDIDEQGAIRIHGDFVLATNPGSDTIAVLRKTGRGMLEHVAGSPFASGGSTPLSLAVHGHMVYVANQAAGFANPKSEPNITGFHLTSEGMLKPIPNSMVMFPKGAGPAQIEFAPDGQTLAVTSGFQVDGGDGSQIHTFKTMSDGRLQAGPFSPIKPMGGTGTVGFSYSTKGDRLFVSTFKPSGVVTFDIDPASAAIRQDGEHVSNDQRAACWTAVSRDGRTLYTGNFVSNSISVFDVTGSKPMLLGSVPRRGATDKDTKDIELSADGQYLYAIGSGRKEISIFRVEANRLLTELPSGQSPFVVTTGQNITGLVTD